MKKLFALGALALLTACSTPVGNYDSQNAKEHWNNYGTDSLSTDGLNGEQALAVFYRPSELQGPAVNVYINGRYQASLLKEGYTPIAVCAEKSLFTASFTTNQQFGNRTQGVTYALPAQEKTFIRVTTDEYHQPIFERVSQAQAEAEMPSKGKVTQTLSRVNSRCDEVVIKNGIMSASALWGLDKYRYQDILPAGKKEIRDLVAFIKANEGRITHIEVSGYTDPEASEAYNLALSQRRADAVRQGLLNSGVNVAVQAVGYGQQNLVAANCRAKFANNPKQRAACNAPNRRVEVTVFGH